MRLAHIRILIGTIITIGEPIADVIAGDRALILTLEAALVANALLDREGPGRYDTFRT